MTGDEQGSPPDRIIKWRRKGNPVWQYVCPDGVPHSTRVLAMRYHRLEGIAALAEMRRGDEDEKYEFRMERLQPWEVSQ